MFNQITGNTILTMYETESVEALGGDTAPFILSPIDNDEVNDDDYSITIATNTHTVTLTVVFADDEAGDADIVLTPRALLPTVTEGSPTSFTAVLGEKPASDVVITLTSSAPGVATVAPATLTFTNGNWDTARTVDVTTVDNAGPSDMAYTVTLSVTSGPGAYGTLAVKRISGTARDKDSPNFSLNPSDNLANIDEDGGTTTFTVVLDKQPVSGVVVFDLSSSAAAVATVVPAKLTFTQSNWNRAQTGTVTAVDNDTIGDGSYVIMAAIDDTETTSDEYDGLPSISLNGEVTEDDVAGFTLLPSLSLGDIIEDGDDPGGSVSFTVELDAQPNNDVVLTLTSSGKEVSLNVDRLTFNSVNWNDRQIVTVSGVDNELTDVDLAFTVTVAVVDALSDVNFDGVSAQELSGTVIDDDIPGFDFDDPSDGSTLPNIDEGGDTTTFVFDLNVAPVSGTVVIDLTSSDPAIATVAPAKLTLTDDSTSPNYWDSEQTVTVTSGDDNIAGAGQNYMITVAVDAANSSSEYAGIRSILSGTVNEDDVADFTLSKTILRITLLEDGSNSTFFSVSLDAQPNSNVVLTVTSSGKAVSIQDAAAADVDTLTFTPDNWNTRQQIFIASVDNNFVDSVLTYMITVGVVASSSDASFRSVDAQTISGVAIMDDDVAGFTPSRTALGTISEDGGSTSFTVVLTAQPLNNNVVLTLTNTGKAVSLNVDTLTFTTGNWGTEQAIMVSGVDNNMQDGDLAFMVMISVDDALSDSDFHGVADQVLSGTVSDDDIPGFELNPSVNLANIGENGQTTTFTVVLNTQPVGDTVIIALTSSDNAIATVTPAELTFTGGVTGNGETAQTGTVTAVDDNTIGADEVPYTITVAVGASSSSEYNSVSVPLRTLNGKVIEDDVAGLIFEPSTLADITEGGDGTTGTVKLSAQPSNDVTLTLTSSDSVNAMVSPAELTISVANWSMGETFTVTPRVDNEESQSNVAYTIMFSSSSSDALFNDIPEVIRGTVRDDDGLSEEQTEIAIASADTFGTAQVATDLISGHLLAPPAAQPQAQLAGISLESTTNLPVQSALEEDPWGNDEENAWQDDIADLIPGTEFALPLSATDSSGGHYEIWGAAGYSDLDGDPKSEGETTEYDGHATGVHIGIGRRYVNGTSFGVSIGSTKVELDIDIGGGDKIKVERDLISIHPYIGWTLQDGLAAWLIAGYGDGDYEQDDEQTKASLLMLGGGLQRSWSVNGNDLAVRLEGVTTESKLDTKGNLKGESSAWQGRVEFEIGRSFAAAGGGYVQPYGTFGYRYDGGDLGGSGAGEVGLGVRSQLSAAWTIDIKSRFQVTDSDHERRSIQGHVKYDRGADRRGWLFTLNNSLEYEVEDADTDAEYTRVLEGQLGYGWSRTLLRQRGTLDLHLKASRGDDHDDPVIGLGFTSPVLRLGLDGGNDEVKVNFNYVYTDF